MFVFLIIPIVVFSQDLSSHLPIISINTNNQNILDSPRIICDMGVINNPLGVNNSTDVHNDYSGKINVEIRGSSSQMYPKKSYSFETQNMDGSNNNVSLLGLPAENDWVLYAPYSDKSLLRNALTYSLFQKMGNYAPRFKYCELIINDQYQGVYVLLEKIKRDDNRVNIKKFDGDDITGGYIIKIDKLTDGSQNDMWCCNAKEEKSSLCFQYHYPKPEDITDQQKIYIQSFVDNTIDSIYSAFIDDSNLNHLSTIDVASFVDYFIITELSKNVDGYILSTFMYKDSDENLGKLSMGPIWDYNLAYGNVNYCDAFTTVDWRLTQNQCTSGMPMLWRYLLQNTGFYEALITRWFTLRENILSTDSVFRYIDEIVLEINPSEKRNFNKWDILAEYVWPNYNISRSHRGEVEFIKHWLFNRLAWIDKNITEIESILNVCSVNQDNLVQIIDQLGRSVSRKSGQTLFYIYQNGCVEKKLISYY